MRNANFDKSSVFRGHYPPTPELSDKDQYQKIILPLCTNSFKNDFHGILPYLEEISPQNVNFVPKDHCFPYFLAFYTGHPELQRLSVSNIFLILVYLDGGLQEM